jgi:hypothetical protein
MLPRRRLDLERVEYHRPLSLAKLLLPCLTCYPDILARKRRPAEEDWWLPFHWELASYVSRVCGLSLPELLASSTPSSDYEFSSNILWQA